MKILARKLDVPSRFISISIINQGIDTKPLITNPL